ncbi:MAG TPA: 3-hydroxyacyl-CoA dehydrogenase family protein, partial [Aquimonas sp.]|nr:3-hydroxyacyl-CoA dehydrogenase family protein [Aquimonas sp.]
MSTTLRIRKVAVLGAGVMGAQIAAHLVNANVDTVLFDLPSKDGDPSSIANKAIANLGKLSPAPLALPSRAAALVPANYDQHLELLRDCDLIIEAIAERIDWKKDLYAKIGPFVAPHAILATNTSGLSVNALAEVLPEELHHRFCGVHFFNPPRYMHLAELIPCKQTEAAVLDGLEGFLTTTLGKGVVRTRDTPNFIANRVGTFAMISTFHHTARLGLGLDVVDTLTGPAIGRPKSGTYRLGDVVGLDTLGHVIRTLTNYLPDDPWHPHYAVPAALTALVEKGALGQKSGAGFYRKQGKDILVLDIATGE